MTLSGSEIKHPVRGVVYKPLLELISNIETGKLTLGKIYAVVFMLYCNFYSMMICEPEFERDSSKPHGFNQSLQFFDKPHFDKINGCD